MGWFFGVIVQLFTIFNNIMAFKNQEKIKQEVVESTEGATNFDDMMGKIATYIQANYTFKIVDAEVVEDDDIVHI